MKTILHIPFLLLMLSLVLAPLSAQQKNQAQPQQAKPQPKQFTPYDAAVKYNKTIYVLEKLNPYQKQHLKAYIDLNNAIRSGNRNTEELFQFTAPQIAECLEVMLPEFQRMVTGWQDKAQEYLEADNQANAKRADLMAKMYAELVKVSKEMLDAYKDNKRNAFNSMTKDYVTAEGYFVINKLKPPQRNWLTTTEARQLTAQLNANKKK